MAGFVPNSSQPSVLPPSFLRLHKEQLLPGRRLLADLGAIPGTFATETSAYCSAPAPTALPLTVASTSPDRPVPATQRPIGAEHHHHHAALVPGTMKVILWSRSLVLALPPLQVREFQRKRCSLVRHARCMAMRCRSGQLQSVVIRLLRCVCTLWGIHVRMQN